MQFLIILQVLKMLLIM